MDIRSLRVLVVGDPGVGKTSLVHLLCQNTPLLKASQTIGCHVDCFIHSSNNTQYSIEFLDIGPAKDKRSLQPLYKTFHGLILVHDLSIPKSYTRLWRWIADVFNAESANTTPILVSGDYDLEDRVNGPSPTSVPFLIIGTKMDLTSHKIPEKCMITDEFRADRVYMNTRVDIPLKTMETIDAFIEKVIGKKYGRQTTDVFQRKPRITNY